MDVQDRAQRIINAWNRERPDLDASSVGIVTRIWHLARVFGAQRRQLLTELGIDPAIMDLLGTLRRNGAPFSLTTRELAARDAVTASAISQRLTRAESKGWVRREQQSHRTVLVHLTDAGRRVVDDTAGSIFDRESQLLSTLDPDEQANLSQLLQALCLELAPDAPIEHVGGTDPISDTAP